jgi:hypothetical protein
VRYYIILLYSELLAAALRYRYATLKVFTNGALLIANTPYSKSCSLINDLIKIVRYYIILLYSELLAAALRYRYATPKVFTNGTLRCR